MDEKQLFEKGCFLPGWTECPERSPRQDYVRQEKDLETLMQELDSIKEKIQEIQAREWHLAKLIHFHQNELACD